MLEEITPQVAQINTNKGCIILYDVKDPTLLVSSSKIKLEQVLVKMMANGIKFSPPGKRGYPFNSIISRKRSCFLGNS